MIKINGKEIIFEQFPNGEVRLPMKDIRIPDNKIANILWKYKDDSDIIKLIFLTKELKDYAHQIHLTIAYMPYSRMDRTENTYAFTLRHTAFIINSLGFDSVRVIDPHSDVTCALLERSTSIYPLVEVIENMYENASNTILFFPDNGAQKKYSKMFRYIPYAYGIKERTFGTGEIEKLDVIGDVKDKDIIIVDDLCVYGGTFIKSAEALKAKGCGNISLVITHCELSIFDGKIPTSELIQRVITTNTIIDTGKDKVAVHNIEDLI